MGIFEDIGRSQATPQITQTVMGLAEFAERRRAETERFRLENERMGLLKESAQREQKLFDVQMQEYERQMKENEHQNELVPMTEMLDKYTPSARKYMLDTLKLYVEGDAIPMVRRKYKADLTKIMNDKEFGYNLASHTVNDLQNEFMQMKSQINDPDYLNKLPEKDVPKVQANYQALIGRYASAVNELDKYKELMKISRKITPEEAKAFGMPQIAGWSFEDIKNAGIDLQPSVKENLPSDIDTFGLIKLGSNYLTTGGKTQLADYLNTTEGQNEYEQFRRKHKEAITITTGETMANAKLAMQLRKEINGLQPVKDYRDVTTKFNIMLKAFEESKRTKNYVAVDQALITLYNKMTDPQSVVRESEYVRTPEDMAIMDRIESAVIRLKKGGRLEEDTRKAIMTMANKFKEVYEFKYNEIVNEYRGYAASAGINPDDIMKTIKSQKRNISEAVNYLKSAKNREDAKARLKALIAAVSTEGQWTEEELREIEAQSGW